MRLISTLFLCLFSFAYLTAQSSGLVVQIAAFEKPVPLHYFHGLNGISHFRDHNNIHKYYLSGFSDETSASDSAQKAKDLGYNAYVIDIDKMNKNCSLVCDKTIDPNKIQSIFFDFDRSFLRDASKSQLNQLYNILQNNLDYNVELSAHTDAKGSLTYNEALSMRRANAAKEYLLNKGISASRIKVSTFGENTPIAKNTLADGQDTPEGRQYNRRVELRVFNPNGSIVSVVEDINVPDSLRR